MHSEQAVIASCERNAKCEARSEAAIHKQTSSLPGIDQAINVLVVKSNFFSPLLKSSSDCFNYQIVD